MDTEQKNFIWFEFSLFYKPLWPFFSYKNHGLTGELTDKNKEKFTDLQELSLDQALTLSFGEKPHWIPLLKCLSQQTDEEIKEDFMSLIPGFLYDDGRREQIENELQTWSRGLQLWVFEKKITPKDVFPIIFLPKGDRYEILNFIFNLNSSKSEAVQLIEFLSEILERDEKSFQSLYKSLKLEKDKIKKDLNSASKTLERVKRLRFPQNSDAQDNFEQLLSKLKLRSLVYLGLQNSQGNPKPKFQFSIESSRDLKGIENDFQKLKELF